MSASVIKGWFEGAAIQDRRLAVFTSTAHMSGAPSPEIDRSATMCGVAAPFSIQRGLGQDGFDDVGEVGIY